MIGSRLKAARFQTKVLVPVVVVMVLLVALTMYVVNYRLTQRLQSEAAQALATADAVFRNSHKIRTKNLRFRFRNLASEPRYRAACLLNDQQTLRPLLTALLGDELGGDMVQFKPAQTSLITTAQRQPNLDSAELARRTELSAREALEGVENTDTICIGDRLFDIVSVPVKTPSGDAIIGALTFCVMLGEPEVREISQLTGSGIVLFANGHVAAASVQRPELFDQCLSLFNAARQLAPGGGGPNPMREIVMPREHFGVFVGHLDSKAADAKLGYVLLHSYGSALRELRATQRTIVGVSVVGIGLSSLVVWLLIRSTTRPLRQLRDSAEAVGRGDFTRRVDVSSQDECGELARVFNRMTANLQASHAELEETVTRLKTTQAQLVQSEKLSAIGEFVAGVTHELNNPLTSVLGFSELLQRTNVDERQQRFIDRIAQSACRCQKIVQSLLSFARQHQPERKSTNANALIDAVLEIMTYEMRTSNIEVVAQLDPALPNVLADAHQLQQVFLNLVNNARQAMEAHQPSGRLRIRSESLYERIRITFQDNGPGIAEENLGRIFDPFFTTKEAGKGTGLGLSLSYGIIQEHGGTISVQSKLGQGALFTIELPVHEPAPGKKEAAENPNQTVPVPSGAGKRVLVVDDEEAILDFVSEALSADGYSVETARDGEGALRRLRDQRYDLTLCDWKMPGLNGQQLYERVNTEDCEACERFVFMTGDVINSRTEAFLKQHQRPCLPKPFSIAEFRSLVARLNDPSHGRSTVTQSPTVAP